MSRNRGFRGWYYFRMGWSTYFAFMFAAINTLTVTFYLAIEKYPGLEFLFPTFFHYVLIVTAIGIPVLISIGYIHFKRTAARRTEMDVNYETNPYVSRTLVNTDMILALNLKLTEVVLKLSTDQKLTEEGIKEVQKLQTEFNNFIAQRTFKNKMDLEFSKEFIELNKKRNQQAKEALFRYLDEIKYAIKNLATPGHTNDEHLLQEESETTNERILLLSFLAMSIPMLGAIFSPDFSWTTKIISATVLFSLPIIYLLIRRIQKSLAYKRNIKEELGRQYKSMFSSIEKDKKRMKLLESMDDLPEDLRNSILDLDRKGMESAEKRLRKLEKYK